MSGIQLEEGRTWIAALSRTRGPRLLDDIKAWKAWCRNDPGSAGPVLARLLDEVAANLEIDFVVIGLTVCPAPEARLVLERLLVSDRNLNREDIVEVLREIGDARSVRALVQALAMPPAVEDMWLRAKIADALGKLHAVEATSELERLVADEEECVSRAAERALAAIGGK